MVGWPGKRAVLMKRWANYFCSMIPVQMLPCRAVFSFRFHIVTKQYILIPEKELAACDHGMRPTILFAAIGLSESSIFFVALRSCLHERDRSLTVLLAKIEVAVSI